MLITLAQAVAGLAMLYLGGEALVRGASGLAFRFGMSSLAIGLTVVAIGTSMPELTVSVDATLAGLGDIAIGNVVGSNICNVGLILGVASLLRPSVVSAKVVRLDAPLMVVVSLCLALALFDGVVSRFEGSLLLIGLAAYIGFTFWESKQQIDLIEVEPPAADPVPVLGLPLGFALVGGGLGLLVGGGHFLVTSAVEIAATLGVSQAVIGLTVVAVGTSLPELVTSVVASLRGHADIAIGNVVGSNIFNILGIVGTSAIIEPLRLGGVGWTDIGVMNALACLLVFSLFVGPSLGRIEGVVLLSCYVLYLGVLVSP